MILRPRGLYRLIAAVALALFLTLPAVAQKAPEKSRMVVRGTTISMTPPAGFSPSKAFAGFEHAPSGSAFRVDEYSPDAYRDMTRELTDDLLATQGITVSARRTVKIAGASGLLLSGTQTAGRQSIGRWILLLRARTGTVMVTVQDMSQQKLDEETVVEALKSVRFRKGLSLKQQVAELPIEFGDLAGFKVVYVAAGTGVVLARRSSRPDDAAQPAVVVSWPTGGAYPTQDGPLVLAQALLHSIAAVSYSEIGALAKVDVAGGEGYELSGEAKDVRSGRKLTITQWLQLKPEMQVRVVAIVSRKQHATLLPALRKLAAGVKVR